MASLRLRRASVCQRDPNANQDPTSAPAREIEPGARGHTGETPLLLWTDCCAYLLAEEGPEETERSPIAQVVLPAGERHSSSRVSGNGGVGMRATGHGPDQFRGFLRASL